MRDENIIILFKRGLAKPKIGLETEYCSKFSHVSNSNRNIVYHRGNRITRDGNDNDKLMINSCTIIYSPVNSCAVHK